MLTLFRQELALGRGLGIESCAVDRVRYRRGVRAVIQYTVRLISPSEGQRLEQWVTGLVYPQERARQVWSKLQKIVPEVHGAGFRLPPAAFARGSSLILQTFPFDRRLPSLTALVDPGRLAPRLPHPERATPGVWKAEPVRYRAGLGCALRWHLDGGCPSNGLTWYVKAYRDNQGANTHQALRALRSAGSTNGFIVPQPVAYLDDHRALVQEEVTGPSLAAVILGREDPSPVMDRVAGALARFHRTAVVPAASRGTTYLLAEIRRAAALVSWVRPSLTDAALSVVARVSEGLDEAQPLTTHGDLKPEHILLSGEGVTFLDLDSFSGSDPVVDVGSMVARLAGMALRHPAMAAPIEASSRAFADAYFARVPAVRKRRFPLHVAGALLQEAAGCFRHQLPSWPELMDAIVQRSLEALCR